MGEGNVGWREAKKGGGRQWKRWVVEREVVGGNEKWERQWKVVEVNHGEAVGGNRRGTVGG